MLLLLFFTKLIFFYFSFFTKLIALCRLHREEKLLRRVAMVAKFLDLNIPGLQIWQKNSEKIDSESLPELRNKTVAHIFPSYANGRLCQEILLRFRNFVTMVTCRHALSLNCLDPMPASALYFYVIDTTRPTQSTTPWTRPSNCRSYEYKCHNNFCVYMWDVCDGSNDCGDNSDEWYCGM